MKKLYGITTLTAALIATSLLLGSRQRVVAAESASPTGIKNVVLVHGAFADGSGWEAVAKILEKDGYTVSVAQPPETSYADDQKYAKAAIDAMDGPVVLVGHSYGGSIITEAGNHPNVAALVYIAAFALDEGESCASIEQAVPQASKAFKPDSNGNWWIEQEHFAADFAADVPPAVSHFMAIVAGADLHRRLHPQGHESRLEDQAHLVHGGLRRPIDQSDPGTDDGEARPCQDGRSERPAMWPTCRIRRKQSSSSKRLPPQHTPTSRRLRSQVRPRKTARHADVEDQWSE